MNRKREVTTNWKETIKMVGPGGLEPTPEHIKVNELSQKNSRFSVHRLSIATIILSVMVFLVMDLISVDLYSHFTIPKLFVLRVCTLALFLSWLYYFKNGLLLPVNKWVLSLTAGYFCWMLVSTTFSLHLPTALHGGYNVHQGFWTLFNYILLFLMVASMPIDKMVVIRAVVNGAGILAIYALVQYFDLDPLRFPHAGRPASFTGNAVPMAGVILLALPFSIFLAVKNEGIDRAYWYALMCLFFVAIASSLSRGAMLGEIVIVVLSIIVLWKNTNRKVIVASLLLAVALTLLTVNFSKHGQETKEDIVAKRYDIVELKSDSSVNSRLQYWSMAIRITKDYPFFGVGADNFRNAYPLYRTAELYVADGNSLNSKAHNGYLQVAATMGIPALILYLGLMASVITVLLKQKGDRLLSLTFVAALIGYMVQDITGWGELGFTTIFWAIIGIGVNVEQNENRN